MPRKPTEPFWIERIRDLAANPPAGRRLTDGEIVRTLELEAKESEGVPKAIRDKVPSERTVGRKRAEFTEDEELVRDYERFRWPESMERGALPWDAAAVAFELIRDNRLTQAPPVRIVRWLHHVTLAIPSAPLHRRAIVALFMACREVDATASVQVTRQIGRHHIEGLGTIRQVKGMADAHDLIRWAARGSFSSDTTTTTRIIPADKPTRGVAEVIPQESLDRSSFVDVSGPISLSITDETLALFRAISSRELVAFLEKALKEKQDGKAG